MNRDEIVGELAAFLSEMLDLPVQEIVESTRLWADLEIDSLSVLELAVFVEDAYEFDIEEVLRESAEGGQNSEQSVGWLADRIVSVAATVSTH